ncbi:MAG: YcaO-like family protein [Roseobacter sp.]
MTMGETLKETVMLEDQRICPAADTLARIMPLMPTFGITRLAIITGLDRLSMPVVAAIRPNARSIAISQGKGVTLAQAKASALMEAIEIWHAERVDGPVFYASIADLEGRQDFVDLDRLPLTPKGPLPRHRRAHWVCAVDLMSHHQKLVPLEMVHADYTLPAPGDVGYFPASTNGLASGNHRLEALCHAICEVIERDALSVWHHLPVAAKRATRLDLKTVTEPGLHSSLQKFATADLDVAVWEVTTDIGAPSFLCLVIDPASDTEHLGLGSGTHPDPVIALHRALNEAAQTRLNYISGAREDLFFDEFSAAGRRRKRAPFQTLLQGAGPQRDFTDIAIFPLTTLEAELDWLKDRLRDIGTTEIAVVDLSRTEHDIPVVRVIIPGLEAPHDDAAYVPGPRARHAVEHMVAR